MSELIEFPKLDSKPKKDWVKIIVSILCVALIIALFLSIDSCEKNQDRAKRFERNNEILKDTILKKDNIIGTLTYSNRALSVDKTELENQIWIKDQKQKELLKQFSKVVLASKISGEVSISDVVLKAPDTVRVPCADFSQQIETKALDSSYSIKQTVSVAEKKITAKIDDLKVPFDLYFNVGYIKKGLLKKDELSSQVTATNKNITFNKVQTQVVQVETPWYKKWWLWFTVGGGSVAILKTVFHIR